MRNISWTMELFSVLTVCVSAAITGLPVLSQGESPPPAIEGKADQLLRKMSDYLAGLKQFQVETENTVEVLLKTGEKIQNMLAGVRSLLEGMLAKVFMVDDEASLLDLQMLRSTKPR